MSLYDKFISKIEEEEKSLAKKEQERRRAEEEWKAGGIERAKRDIRKIEKELEENFNKWKDKSSSARVTDYCHDGRNWLKDYFTKQGFTVKITYIEECTDAEGYPEAYYLDISL